MLYTAIVQDMDNKSVVNYVVDRKFLSEYYIDEEFISTGYEGLVFGYKDRLQSEDPKKLQDFLYRELMSYYTNCYIVDTYRVYRYKDR